MSSPLDPSIDFSLVTYPERLRRSRAQLFPVITPEEDAAIAKRTGRARRVVRHAPCGRAVRVGQPCWWCEMRRGR
jgi:hypothetical protein